MKSSFFIIVVILLVFITICANAQGFYLKAGAGYRLGWPKTLIGTNYLRSSDYLQSDGVFGTYGQGVVYEGTIGCEGGNFGIEVAVSFMPKSSVEIFDEWNPRSGTSSDVKYITRYERSILTLTPCLVFISDAGFYGRAGAVFGFPKVSEIFHVKANDQETGTRRITEFRGNMAIGFTGAVGFALGFNGINLFVETEFVSLSWPPNEKEITEWKEGAVDALPGILPFEKKWFFKNSSSVNNLTQDLNQPSEAIQVYFPYSSLGLKAGIAIGF